MSFTTTVRCELEEFTAVARVTLFSNPRGCVPDPPDVQWIKVIRGCGTEESPEETTIALEDYDAMAVELAESDLEDLEAFDRCCA